MVAPQTPSPPPTPTMMTTSEPEAKESVVLMLQVVGVGGDDVMIGRYTTRANLSWTTLH